MAVHDPIEERDARDEWYAAHEAVDRSEEVLNDIGDALTHMEFALDACERVEVFLWPNGFGDAYEALQQLRNRFQRIFEDRIEGLETDDMRRLREWPAALVGDACAGEPEYGPADLVRLETLIVEAQAEVDERERDSEVGRPDSTGAGVIRMGREARRIL